MRHALLGIAAIGLVGLLPATPLVAADLGVGATDNATALSPDSFEARCAADSASATVADVEHCVARLRAEWQREQMDTVRSAPVEAPDVSALEADLTAPGSDQLQPALDGLAKNLRLSLDND